MSDLTWFSYRLLQEFNGINYTILDVADSKQIYWKNLKSTLQK